MKDLIPHSAIETIAHHRRAALAQFEEAMTDIQKPDWVDPDDAPDMSTPEWTIQIISFDVADYFAASSKTGAVNDVTNLLKTFKGDECV